MMVQYLQTQCDKRDASIEFLTLKLKEKDHTSQRIYRLMTPSRRKRGDCASGVSRQRPHASEGGGGAGEKDGAAGVGGGAARGETHRGVRGERQRGGEDVKREDRDGGRHLRVLIHIYVNRYGNR